MKYLFVFIIGAIFGMVLLIAIACAVVAGDADERMGCK